MERYGLFSWRGPLVLGLLIIALFLFGGGIAAQIVFAPFLVGLFIAIFGYVPGVAPNDDDLILTICWAFVFGGGWGGCLLSYIAGFAHDIEKMTLSSK